MTTIQPLGERVLIERVKAAEVRAGGIHLPPKDERPAEGVVLAIGPQVHSAHIRPGARVLFTKYAGQEITADGSAFLIVDIEKILAVLTDAETLPDNVVPFRQPPAGPGVFKDIA